MRWTERQRAMLQAIGVRLFEATPAIAQAQPSVRPEVSPGAARGPSIPQGERAGSSTPRGERIAIAPADIALLGWDALREAVAACQACALGQSRQQTVFGTGNRQAHWMIVGEAPGEQEDRQGEPFVGDSGQLLDNMLSALGLSRTEGPPERQVFIANTLKCRPPRNRNPEPAETAQCAPFLQRQIALVAPRIVLAMGRFAAQALLGSSEPVGKLRGRIHRVKSLQDVPVVVTYHPAYLLRTPADKARAWEDLCLAATAVEESRSHE